MPRWHNQYEDGHIHFCTLTVSDWRPLLVGDAVDVLYAVWEESRAKLDVKALAYVVMPEHFHIMLGAEHGLHVRDFMQRTGSLVSKQLQPGGGMWKERPRVMLACTPAVIRVKVDYIHRNPITRGLVDGPDEWVHSSYRQLILGARDVPFVCDGWDGLDVG